MRERTYEDHSIASYCVQFLRSYVDMSVHGRHIMACWREDVHFSTQDCSFSWRTDVYCNIGTISAHQTAVAGVGDRMVD